MGTTNTTSTNSLIGSALRMAAAGCAAAAVVAAVAISVPQAAGAKALTSSQAAKRVEKSIASGKTWVKFKPSEKVDSASARRAFNRALYGSTTRMMKVSGYRLYSVSKSKYSTWIKLGYYSKAQRRKLKAALREATDAAGACATQEQKARAVRDAVNARCTYDYATWRSGKYTDVSHNAYGCLVLGTCVCGGYAAGFQLAALSAGVKSVYASSGNHAWNIVKVDGRWYHVDCTWDDTAGAGDAGGSKYFLLGSESVAKLQDHEVREAYPSMPATSAGDWHEPDAGRTAVAGQDASAHLGRAVCDPADDPSNTGAAHIGGGASISADEARH